MAANGIISAARGGALRRPSIHQGAPATPPRLHPLPARKMGRADPPATSRPGTPAECVAILLPYDPHGVFAWPVLGALMHHCMLREASKLAQRIRRAVEAKDHGLAQAQATELP
jgi:hypothetical protein